MIVAREAWDGYLWAARPATVVTDDGDTLVHWCPAGTIGCFATSRHVPGRSGLPREERQLVSLETRLVHWYVNFQLPLVRQADGYETLDLVLDIVVDPDSSWRWKDRAPFEAACKRKIFDVAVADAVEDEARRIQEEIAARSGPFDPRWSSWTAPADWSAPALPVDFAGHLGAPPGSVITLAKEPVVL